VRTRGEPGSLPGPPAAKAGDPGERDPAGAATADDPEPALAGAIGADEEALEIEAPERSSRWR